MAAKIPVLATAPDFELTSTTGEKVHLAEILPSKYVVLVLLRAFA